MAEQAAPLGPQDLAAIRARADAATPGPWQQSLSARDAVIAPAGPLEIGADAWRYYGGRVIGESISPSDRMFIITARTDVPRLLDAYADLARTARAYLDACGLQFLGDCSQTGPWGEIVTAEQALRESSGARPSRPPPTTPASHSGGDQHARPCQLLRPPRPDRGSSPAAAGWHPGRCGRLDRPHPRPPPRRAGTRRLAGHRGVDRPSRARQPADPRAGPRLATPAAIAMAPPMTTHQRSRRLRHLHDGDVFSGPFELGWADDGTRLWYPHVQVFAPEPGEAAAGFVVVRLLDDDFNPVAEQHWPAKWLTHTRGIRRHRSSIRRGPRIT